MPMPLVNVCPSTVPALRESDHRSEAHRRATRALQLACGSITRRPQTRYYLFETMHWKLLLLIVSVSLHSPSDALAAVPNLDELAPKIFSQRLNYRVAVGSEDAPFQFKDLHVELGSNQMTPKPYSTGIHDIDLLQKPFYVNWRGKQDVTLENGGWELIWQQKSPHGFLACSFVSPEKVKRTKDAVLEAGRLFMYHRVWTEETLASERERRLKIQEEVAEKFKDRDAYFQKLADDKENVGSKVMSYAKAAKSMNEYYTSGYEESLFVPYYDDQVLKIDKSCIVSTRGLVYKTNDKGEAVKIGDSRVEFLERGD